MEATTTLQAPDLALHLDLVIQQAGEQIAEAMIQPRGSERLVALNRTRNAFGRLWGTDGIRVWDAVVHEVAEATDQAIED